MTATSKKFLIIDTDPGVDDAMAILAAFNSPEVEVIGLTTVFGNVRTPQATINALVLRELAGREDVPVAQGALSTVSGLTKQRVADFVHGSDGFGNLPEPRQATGVAVSIAAAQFLVEEAAKRPGQVSVLALGPLTNLALATQLDPQFLTNLAELVILGGAFFVNGNVNPAAEANIFGDPEAADLIFSSSSPCNIRVVGLDVTHQVVMQGQQLAELKDRGRFGSFLYEISRFYLQYHRDSYGVDSIYLHDPTAMAAVLHPELFTWADGQIRVACEGFARGHTIMDRGLKIWRGPNEWSEAHKVQVAVGVRSEEIVKLVWQCMSA